MSLPSTHKDYYGDETRWFLGTVVRIDNDPERLGRVKVRIYGVHPSDPFECPEGDLPWASVVLPSTEAGTSGFGGTVGIKPTAQVFGIFLDGKNSQLPLILGTIPKKESMFSKSGRELIDRNGYYQNEENTVELSNSDGDGTITYLPATKFDEDGKPLDGYAFQTRNKQIQRELYNIIETAAKATGVRVVIISGGQDIEGHGIRRVGTTRHDAGYAADIWVYDGQNRRLGTSGRDPVMNKFILELGAAGAKGIGAHPRYMIPEDKVGNAVHVDLWGDAKGTEMWGEGGTGKPPKAIEVAFKEGKQRFYQQGVIPSTSIKNKNGERSLASAEYKATATKAVQKRVSAETVSDKTNPAFTPISYTTSSKPVKDEPVVAVMTSTVAGETVSKTNTATSDIGSLTGSTSGSADKLDEVVVQNNLVGMNAGLTEGINVATTKVPNIIKASASIEDIANEAITDVQEGGIEQVLGDQTVEASRKISTELGNPFGSLNVFGGIASGVSNIISQLVAQTFNQPGFKSLLNTTAFVPDGVQLTDAEGKSITPPPVIKEGGLSNVTEIVTGKTEKRNLYVAGQGDAEWAGLNSRGTNVGGTYEFKTLSSTDHIEAEFRFASNQREITCLIIDWSNLPFGYDDYTVDEIHQAISNFHTTEYGISRTQSRPNDYGLQTHMYVHQSGLIKKVVPPKNKIISLGYPVRQKIYDNAIHITLNASEKTGRPHRQLESMDEIIKTFIKVFPGAEIYGANDLLPENSTTAPGFSVRPYILRKFGKASINDEIPVKEVLSAKQLADLQPANIVTPQPQHNKLPDPNKLITDLSREGFDATESLNTWFNDNQDTIDLLRQKAEKVFEALQIDGSGITDNAVKVLDETQDNKLTENLRNKMSAAAKGIKYV